MEFAVPTAVDTETTGVDLHHACRPFMVQAYDQHDEARVWEWPVDPYTRQPLIPTESLDDLCHYLTGRDLVFHNATFDLRALSRIGILISFTDPPFSVPKPGASSLQRKPRHIRQVKCGCLHDTQIMSHAAYSLGTGGDSPHGLKALALHYLDFPTTDEKELQKATVAARRIGKKLGWSLGTSLQGEKQVNADYWMPHACYKWAMDYLAGQESPFDELPCIPLEWETIASNYGVKDVMRTLGLWVYLAQVLDEEGLWANYERERQLLPVTYLMEERGMYVKQEALEDQLALFDRKCIELKERVEHNLQIENLNSDEQLAERLRQLGTPTGVRTPKGNDSVNADTLRSLAQYLERSSCEDHIGIAASLRDIIGFDPDKEDQVDEASPGYRTYATGQRYLRQYQFLRAADGRVHPSFHQSGIKFTRYSSSNPNGQNVSAKAVLPLRAVYGPPPGFVWVAIDYSQVELRIYGTAAGEQSLLDAFDRGDDIHKFVACKMFNCTMEEVTPERKRYAKCFHPDTEVLTKQGWVKISCLANRQLIAQAIPQPGKKVKLEWVIPTEIFTEPNHHGFLVQLKNEGINLRVTPDHRMLGYDYCREESKPKNFLPEELSKAHWWINAGELAGKKVVRDDLLRLAVATQADGSFSGRTLRFGFTKSRKIRRLRKLLRNACIGFTEKKSGGKVTTFTISAIDALPIRELLQNKMMPWDWLSLIRPLRETVIDESQYWDAHCGQRSNAFTFYSAIEQNIDVLQAIAASVGRKTRKAGKRGKYRLTIRTKSDSVATFLKPERILYDGLISCLSVPSGYILARDGGIPIIVGQSQNFKAIYGGIKNVLPEFSASFPRAVSFMRQIEDEVKRQGYVSTLFGYRLYIQADKPYVGVDALSQGTCGDIVKNSMIDVHRMALVDWLPDGSAIIANIHDEVIYEFPLSYPWRAITRRIIQVMEQAGARLGVKTPTEAKVIFNDWAHPQPFNRTAVRGRAMPSLGELSHG
jgi:hypothetical protein